MDVNPYESSKPQASEDVQSTEALGIEDLSFVEMLQRYRRAQRRWNWRSRGIALGLLAAGFGAAQLPALLQLELANPLISILRTSSAILYAAAAIVFIFGPIAFFWFHRARKLT